jgi:hypothetical protein
MRPGVVEDLPVGLGPRCRSGSVWISRVGWNSMLVWKKVQVSQMASKAQSSSGGWVQ